MSATTSGYAQPTPHSSNLILYRTAGIHKELFTRSGLWDLVFMARNDECEKCLRLYITLCLRWNVHIAKRHKLLYVTKTRINDNAGTFFVNDISPCLINYWQILRGKRSRSRTGNHLVWANSISGICRHVLFHPRDISLNCLIKLMCSGDRLLKIKKLMYIVRR